MLDWSGCSELDYCSGYGLVACRLEGFLRPSFFRRQDNWISGWQGLIIENDWVEEYDFCSGAVVRRLRDVPRRFRPSHWASRAVFSAVDAFIVKTVANDAFRDKDVNVKKGGIRIYCSGPPKEIKRIF